MSLSTLAQSTPRTAEVRSIGRAAVRSTCALCSSRRWCWGGGRERVEESWFADLEFSKRKIKRGETLYRMGTRFDNLYAIRSGFFKTSVLLEDGRDQVTAFKMQGELLGLDGIGEDEYMSDAIALEDSEVCVIAYDKVVRQWRSAPELAAELNRLLSREIAQDQNVMALLGTMQAQERVTVFLLNLAQRFKARGYSATAFVLRMTREEIGSYLGLKLETVSRIFSRLQAQGLIEITQNRNVVLRDLDKLRACIPPALAAKQSVRQVPAPQRPGIYALAAA
jgi:CRP/FNR family transcriptional regulator, anaerobic regulatory protein